MLKKSVYIIGLFSLLAVIACSSGTVDPNANPLAYAYESSSSMGEQSISSSAMSSSLDTTNKNLESSPNTVHIIKDDTVFVVVNTDAGIAVHLDIDTLYPRLEFSTEATHQYSIAIGNKKGVMDSNDGQVAVYEKEQGATAICDNNENKYFAKFKLGQNNHIEKTIELKNYGSACDSILVSFEESCKFAKSKEGIVGACDKDGNLEAYCSYVDGSADFDTLLREFTEEVEKICEEGHCQINKTN